MLIPPMKGPQCRNPVTLPAPPSWRERTLGSLCPIPTWACPDPPVIFVVSIILPVICLGVGVTTKEKVRKLLDGLPDDCSIEDVLYHLYVIQSIDRGLADIEAGKTIPHEEVAEQLRRKWVLGAAG